MIWTNPLRGERDDNMSDDFSDNARPLKRAYVNAGLDQMYNFFWIGKRKPICGIFLPGEDAHCLKYFIDLDLCYAAKMLHPIFGRLYPGGLFRNATFYLFEKDKDPEKILNLNVLSLDGHELPGIVIPSDIRDYHFRRLSPSSPYRHGRPVNWRDPTDRSPSKCVEYRVNFGFIDTQNVLSSMQDLLCELDTTNIWHEMQDFYFMITCSKRNEEQWAIEMGPEAIVRDCFSDAQKAHVAGKGVLNFRREDYQDGIGGPMMLLTVSYQKMSLPTVS